MSGTIVSRKTRILQVLILVKRNSMYGTNLCNTLASFITQKRYISEVHRPHILSIRRNVSFSRARSITRELCSAVNRSAMAFRSA